MKIFRKFLDNNKIVRTKRESYRDFCQRQVTDIRDTQLITHNGNYSRKLKGLQIKSDKPLVLKGGVVFEL